MALEGEMQECVVCRMQIPARAEVCPYCRYNLGRQRNLCPKHY
jgi:predicted amidophosphoribosyltransferase